MYKIQKYINGNEYGYHITTTNTSRYFCCFLFYSILFFFSFFCFLLVSCCGALAVMARYHIIHKISSFTLKLYMHIGGFVHHQYSINMINFITMINSASFILSLLEST